MARIMETQSYKIGLEIHVYVNVENRKKLFCTCTIDPNASVNTTICPICTAQPGSKPMLPNKEAIYKIIKTALMLNCKINSELIWQRKHYDWPDLPKGYQNTMSGSYAVPVGERGNFLGIGITECHLEEDPARWDPVSGCVDYNRSGYPLIEIVTNPDFKDQSEVRQWLKKLITTLSYVDATKKSMGVKCDVNVSIAPKYDRVEIKNVNSFSGIIGAIEYELERQQKEVSKGKKIKQQTRQWNGQRTSFMRSKEDALDYMFIPDPDLPVVVIDQKLLSEIKKELPEKPEQKLKKLLKAGVEKTTAEVIATDLPLSELFERLTKKVKPTTVANWIRKELLRMLNRIEKDVVDVELNELHLIELLTLLELNKITENVGRKILKEYIKKPFSPKEYVQKHKLRAISGKNELEKLCKEAIIKHTKPVHDYKAGRENALDFLVGQVMRATSGKASPHELKELFKKLLN
jgi:aspartyl-tRNA(Asn)/glutamyl-tRNA(Gln) amidotransferase subunit B